MFRYVLQDSFRDISSFFGVFTLNLKGCYRTIPQLKDELVLKGKRGFDPSYRINHKNGSTNKYLALRKAS